ncbi:MAG: twin-arginine translocase TatA/TatE family subunit [Acidobacteriota bacterium]
MGSLGWSEILIILTIALIIFGPRKLPQLGKSLGESLAQFRRASEDFKRTWEREVEVEQYKLESASLNQSAPTEIATTDAATESASTEETATAYSENPYEDSPATVEPTATEPTDKPEVALSEPRQDWT